MPEELHYFALNFNWDTSCSELAIVLEHPLCDRGTALLIYWLAGPGWFQQFSSRDDVEKRDRERFDLVRVIEHRYLGHEFRSSRIRVDPKNLLGHDATSDYLAEGANAHIHDAMLNPSAGIPVLDLLVDV